MSARKGGTSTADEPRHPIRVVSERTGLSPDVLRVWQKRYGVVEPGRSERGRRLYTDAELERLRLLSLAVRGGRSISSIAQLDVRALAALVEEDARARARPDGGSAGSTLVVQALAATRALDPAELSAVLLRGLVLMSVPTFIDEVAAPLFHQIGEGWANGELTPAHEHMASAVVRRILEWVMSACEAKPRAARIVIATLPGEQHEIGALFAATTAATEGWHVTYLGADLPIESVAAAVRQSKAKYVGVSAVFTEGPVALAASLQELSTALPANVVLVVGGAAARALSKRALTRSGCLLLPELGGLREFLRQHSTG